MNHHLNHIILHDGEYYRVFERMGKQVPFDAYNNAHHLGIGTTQEEAIANSDVPRWDIEESPYEVIKND